MGRRLGRLEPAPATGVGRRGGSARPRAARGGSPRSGTAQHGSGGAVGAPMRRRTGRSLPDPSPAAPNRSADGAPAPVHGRLGSRSQSAGTGAGEHGLGGRLEEDAHGVQPLGGSAERDRERERATTV